MIFFYLCDFYLLSMSLLKVMGDINIILNLFEQRHSGQDQHIETEQEKNLIVVNLSNNFYFELWGYASITFIIRINCIFESFTVGKINVEKSNTDWLKIESKYTMVTNGSHHPENCSARHKVAILVPFRDRENHLRIFLNHMHAFLMKQQLEYAIYVVELVGLIHMNYYTTFL